MASHRMGRAAGYISIVSPDHATKEYDTLQCVHCGSHFYTEAGSGRQRGWCLLCGGPHCGRQGCWECVPLEERLREMEQRAAFAKAAGLVMK